MISPTGRAPAISNLGAGLKRRASTLTTPARRTTLIATVAAAVAGHDGAANMAGGCVAQVDQVFQRVGGVHKAVVSCQLPVVRKADPSPD
jgi:hypothetical protein